MKRLILVLLMLVALIQANEKFPTQEEIAKLYVATFNRAPDAGGLAYWRNDSGLTLSEIARSFFVQTETKALYPDGTSNRDFIQSVYANLFNREPDIGGWNYWESELDREAFTRDTFIQAVIKGALDNDEGLDATILANKTRVGLSFAEAGLENTDDAKTIMLGITADEASVTLALNIISTNFDSKSTFVLIHFEAGYQGRLNNDLPIDIPDEYMTMDFGWQEYLFDTAKKLVQKADDYGFHLSLAFNPQWAEYILLDNTKVNTLKKWQENGHEIAFHHHSISHPDWNGYSNAPDAVNNPIPFLGEVDIGLNFVKNLATPSSVTTAMIGGLPVDMPQSYENTTEDLIFASGNQYNSFELYGELRSLKPYKVIKNNGAKITYVTHRQLTSILENFTVNEALEIFKTEYANMGNDEIYGITFHCYDYHEAEETYNNWFEFIKNNGDTIKTVDEVVSDYQYDIPIQSL